MTRHKWTDDLIVSQLKEIAVGGVMPTNSELRAAGKNALACALTKRGGFDHFAEKCGLNQSQHASRKGWAWESVFIDSATNRGLKVDARTRVKEPCDCVVSGKKVDVKVATGAWAQNGLQWTWRIAKKSHTCDIYAFFAIYPDGSHKLFMIPSSDVSLTCVTMRDNGRFERHEEDWSVF